MSRLTTRHVAIACGDCQATNDIIGAKTTANATSATLIAASTRAFYQPANVSTQQRDNALTKNVTDPFASAVKAS